MSLVALCSVHGSPGVTTTALALAGAWPEERRYLLVEADPFGGVVAARFRLGDTPGLASLAAVARRGLDSEVLWQHAQQLPGGVPVVVGPPSADHAHAVLRDLAPYLAKWCIDNPGVDVIADCGRLGPGAPNLELVLRADAALVATRPTADQLRPAAYRARSLEATGAPVRLLIGDIPYGPEEVATTLQLGVAGVMAWDSQAAEALGGGVGFRDVRRSLLARSAAALAESLVSELGSGGDASDGASEPSRGAATVGGEVG
jgi:MinD-like ATPase involved in chromosome partitioning or flagellar assembly